MENIGGLLKHPLVIIVAVLLAALVFYNIASPYKNCIRSNTDRYAYVYDYKVTGRLSTQACWKKCLETYGSNTDGRQFCAIMKSIKKEWSSQCKQGVSVKRPAAEPEKRAASYCNKKGHSW